MMEESSMAYYPTTRKPIPLFLLFMLLAACVYGLLYPFLQTGAFTRWWYHVTSNIPIVSDAPSISVPAGKQGYVQLARADALAAGIPPDAFVRQINQESSFNPDSLSPAGAEGIAQFMPDTAAGLGIDPWNPVAALQGAAQLMARYQHNYDGDYAKALAAYNGGSGTLQYCMKYYGSGWFSCEPAETQAYIQKIMSSERRKLMFHLTMRGKHILYAFGYAVSILVGPLILAATIWTVTGNPDLVSCSFWGVLFLGVLAVFTDELRKRDAILSQQSRVKQAVTSSSYAPVLTWNAPDIHHVRTETTVDLNVGMFALHMTRCTDLERTWCVPGQYLPSYTPPNQIIKIMQD